MEIGPIPGIRNLPALKARPVDPELNAVFEIEPTAAPGDDTYTGGGKKAAGAEDIDEGDREGVDDSPETEPDEKQRPGASGSQISFFA